MCFLETHRCGWKRRRSSHIRGVCGNIFQISDWTWAESRLVVMQSIEGAEREADGGQINWKSDVWSSRCCLKRSKQKQSVCNQLEQMLSKVQCLWKNRERKAKKPWACLALVWERLCSSFNSASRLLKLFPDVCCDEFPTLTGWDFCAVCLSHFFSRLNLFDEELYRLANYFQRDRSYFGKMCGKYCSTLLCRRAALVLLPVFSINHSCE